jgi:hypothetical protein
MNANHADSAGKPTPGYKGARDRTLGYKTPAYKESLAGIAAGLGAHLADCGGPWAYLSGHCCSEQGRSGTPPLTGNARIEEGDCGDAGEHDRRKTLWCCAGKSQRATEDLAD